MRSLLASLLLLLPLWTSAQVVTDSAASQPVPAVALAPADSVAPLTAAMLPDTAATRPSAPDSALQRLQALPAAERKLRGQADAKRYYRPKGMFAAGMGTGLAGPLLLVAPGQIVTAFVGSLGSAVVISVSGPKPEKLRASAPHPELLQDADYQAGYKQQAGAKKAGRVMLGWGVGTLTTLTTLVVIVAMSLQGGFS